MYVYIYWFQYFSTNSKFDFFTIIIMFLQELDPEAASRKRKLFKCYENLDLDAPEETDDLLNLGIPTISKVWRIPLLDKISEEIKQLENAGDDTVGKDIEDIEKNKTAGKEVEIQAAEKMETVEDETEIGVTESIKQVETVGDETENQDMECQLYIVVIM